MSYLDDLIKEYLLFRGYIKTYTAFTSEKQHDKTDHPDPDAIAELLLNHIRQLELNELTDLWSTLTTRFFTHLPPHFAPTIKTIETSLRRAYLIKAIRTADKAKIHAFFDRFSTDMTQPGGEWEQWFILPYLKDPASHPLFASYFHKRFFHTLALSVRNFLVSAFAQLPLPKLMAFNVERGERKAMTADIKALKADNERLKREMATLRQQLQAVGSKPASMSIVTSASSTSISAVPTSSSSASSPTPVSAAGASPTGALSHSVSQPLRVTSASASPLDDEFTDPAFIVTHDHSVQTNSSAVAKVRFSMDGSRLAAGNRDGSIRVYNVEKLVEAVKQRRSNGGGSASGSSDYMRLEAQMSSTSSDLTCMEWDAMKDRYLAFGSSDAHIRLWSPETKKQLADLTTNTDFPTVLALASSPSSPFLVAATATRAHSTVEGSRGLLEAWDVSRTSRALTFTVESVLSQVNCVVFNHNGNMLVSGGADGMVRIYDMATKKPIMGWPAHAGQVGSVRLCSDETTVISSGVDGRIVEWSLHRIGRQIRILSLPSPLVVSKDVVRSELAIENENEHFVLSSAPLSAGGMWSNAAFLYSIRQPRPVQALSLLAGSVSTVDWHGGGVGVVACGGSEGSVRLRGMQRVEGRVVRDESKVDNGEEEEEEEEEEEDGEEEEEEEGEEGEEEEEGEEDDGGDGAR